MKAVIKAMLFSAGVVLVSPLIVLCWIESRAGRSEVVFVGSAQLVALIPSHIGVVLRGAFYWAALTSCSREVHIGFGSLFTHRNARVADNVSTGSYCVLGHVDIGTGVMMGSRVSIPSGKRQHFGETGEIVTEARYETVRIGAGTWIGEGAIVLADVGQGSVVSAGAVVTKPMPEYSIVGGNPAQVIKVLDRAERAGSGP